MGAARGHRRVGPAYGRARPRACPPGEDPHRGRPRLCASGGGDTVSTQNRASIVAGPDAGSTPAPLDRGGKTFVAGHRGLVGAAILRRLQSEGFENLITRTHGE